jgi:N-acyl-D-aspartate/D-glutamate deacylase
VRARILEELSTQDMSIALLHKHRYVFALDVNAHYGCDLDESIAAIAARTGRSREDIAYDVLLSDSGRGVLWAPASNFLTPNYDVTRELLVHPYTLPGVGDGGAHCRFICDTSFPTFLLTHWVRDAAPDQRLELEWVVKRQAADTAAWVGLTDRGVLAPGRKADINVIDLDNLALDRPEMRADFPLGGGRLVQRATGYRATIVAGTVLIDDGQHTGALPGRLARGGALQIP